MGTSRSRPVGATAKDLLGVPFVPTGGQTAWATRARGALGRLHAALAPPPLRVVEGCLALVEHRAMVALCAADVPDALTRPTTITDLARRVGADPDVLERLLRFAATRGWVRIDRRGRVRPSRVTPFLRRDHPGGWRAWVDFAGGDDVVAAVAGLSATDGEVDPFASVHGTPFFSWMAAHPDRADAFDGAMAAGGRMHGLVLAAALDWPDGQTVCDVGGGTGALLATLLDLVPGATGTVLDLPHVVARAVDHPRLASLAGDAFEAVPEGFDTYLLVNVVHDWGDDDAVRLLRVVAGAVPPAGRVVVVEGDRPTVPVADVAVATDLLMAALTGGGRERDARALGALGRRAGLALDRSVRLASGDLAHVFVPTADAA